MKAKVAQIHSLPLSDLGAMLEALPHAMILVNGESKIVFANEKSLELFGYSLSELQGQNVTKLIPERFRESHRSGSENYKLSPHPAYLGAERNLLALHKNGLEIPVEIGLHAVQFEGSSEVFTLTAIIDSTLRKEAESQINSLLVKERELRELADEAITARDTFISMVAYELRNSLHIITGWLALIANESRKNQATNSLSQILQVAEFIEKETRNQTKLVEDLLNFSQIMSGKLHCEFVRTDCILLLKELLENIGLAMKEKEISLVSDVQYDTYTLLADPVRLRQVFLNLLSNAVKFTPQGGEVRLNVCRDGDFAKISIKDNGIGIEETLLPVIYEPFRQATTTRKGLGLGLYIVKQLVTLHNGTVESESPGLGLGSTFTVRLPLAQKLNNKNTHASEEQTQLLLKGYKILVVEDDKDSREMLATLLRSYGAYVDEAGTAARAMEFVDQHEYDILISDIGLPGMDGHDLIRTIRLERSGSSLPAIAVTGYTLPELETIARETGFQAFHLKPLDFDSIVSSIRELSPKKETVE